MKAVDMELTEVEFWDEYWANCRLPNVVDGNFSFDRCLRDELLRSLAGCRGEVLEVGCVPGKWLAFMAEDMGLVPSGIDFSKSGVECTLRNLEMLGIEHGRIVCGDFLKLPADRRFDVVLSLGFIEHFSDVDAVVGRHLDWLKPGGTLVLGVPNFRGVYGPIQAVLDKTVLDKHNLEIMSTSFFEELGPRFDLILKSVAYIGSFEPLLPMGRPGVTGPAQFFVKAFLRVCTYIRRLRLFDRLNSRFFSSYILAVYTRES
ncbi:MAG: class I SAM-dependent methyltransferase [Actinomycetota bacterium]|nr:class I SAM-dependent methyltransferase [Actinomycetota bacterium]